VFFVYVSQDTAILGIKVKLNEFFVICWQLPGGGVASSGRLCHGLRSFEDSPTNGGTIRRDFAQAGWPGSFSPTALRQLLGGGETDCFIIAA